MTDKLELICPISQQEIKIPVIADDGHTYEKRCIEQWLKRSNLSPITRKSISNMLIPNMFARQFILAKNPDAVFDNRELWKKFGELNDEQLEELIIEDFNLIHLEKYFSKICKVNKANIFKILKKHKFNFNIKIGDEYCIMYLLECLKTNRDINSILLDDNIFFNLNWTSYNKLNCIRPISSIFQVRNINCDLTKKILTEYDGSFALLDKKKNNMLHYAVEYCSDVVISCFFNINLEFLERRNKNGNTPLHIAVQFSSKDIIIELASRMSNSMHIKNKVGNTPLFIALQFKNDEVALELMKIEDIDFNIKNKNGNTLLHIASQFSGLEVIKKIVEKSNIVNEQNYLGNTALHNAYKYNTPDVIEYLENSPASKLLNKEGYYAFEYARKEEDE